MDLLQGSHADDPFPQPLDAFDRRTGTRERRDHKDPVLVGGTAHLAHLGGMVVGYFYLTRGRGGPWAEIKYRYTKWRMNRLRRRFDVHEGGQRGGRGGFGGPGDRWNIIFSPIDRRQAASHYAEEFLDWYAVDYGGPAKKPSAPRGRR